MFFSVNSCVSSLRYSYSCFIHISRHSFHLFSFSFVLLSLSFIRYIHFFHSSFFILFRIHTRVLLFLSTHSLVSTVYTSFISFIQFHSFHFFIQFQSIYFFHSFLLSFILSIHFFLFFLFTHFLFYQLLSLFFIQFHSSYLLPLCFYSTSFTTPHFSCIISSITQPFSSPFYEQFHQARSMHVGHIR